MQRCNGVSRGAPHRELGHRAGDRGQTVDARAALAGRLAG